LEKFEFTEQYVTKLRLHDEETERHFVDYFTPLLRIKLRTRSLNWQDIEDVTQEVFLRALKAICCADGLRSPGSLPAFVVAVCERTCMEVIRRQIKSGAASDDNLDLSDEKPSIEDRMISESKQHSVWQLLNEMPQRDHDLLIRVFIQEEDKSRVCEELGVDRDYLRVLLHRALQRFRRQLTRDREWVHRI
jgi:RNA polymerase sigma-70 factor, ECF subfamily